MSLSERAAEVTAKRLNGAEPEVELICGADIEIEAHKWLWHEWLAQGQFHILAGAPGTGKTTIALALAATLTSGGRWPDGTRAIPGVAVIWSGEDDRNRTLAPRLVAMAADMKRVRFVGRLYSEDKPRPFDPSTDAGALLAAVSKMNPLPSLLIVDPIVSAVGGDSHKNGETRRALQPLVDFASATDCALFGVSHFSKGTAGRDPVERVTGSIAFGAFPRIVLASARLTDAEEGQPERMMVRSKSNIGPDGAVFEATHGSAPKYKGLNKVNPTALILSGMLMLRHMGEREASEKLENAVAEVIAEGKDVTYDLKPHRDDPSAVGTQEMAAAICAKM